MRTKQQLQDEIDNLEQEKEDFEKFTEEDCDEFLDDCYPEVDILGVKYCMSNVLKAVDEVRYNAVLSEEEDRMRTEFEEEKDEEIQTLKDEIDELEEQYQEYLQDKPNTTYEQWEQQQETIERL